jgi:hypothetical protein
MDNNANGRLLSLETIQKITIGFGIVYALVGVLGFIPGIVNHEGMNMSDVPNEGLLMGIFGVNLVHNLAHILLGMVIIGGAFAPDKGITINRIMAVVFLILAASYFIDPLARLMSLNLPDLFLHLGSALLTGFLGFVAYRTVRDNTTMARDRL